MPEIIDMIGKRFGMLTVIERAPDHYTESGRRAIYWRCKCDCGNIKDIDGNSLRHGVKSCGCLNVRPTSHKEVEYATKPLPKAASIQDNLEIGGTLKIDGRKRKLIGKYENFGRFQDKYGMIRCYGWWDVERMVRGCG